MQIKLVIESIEEEQVLQDLNICAKDSAVICLKSISSWIVEYYFTNQIINKSRQSDHFIGLYDMFVIYQRIQSSSLGEFFELCKNKMKQMKNDFILENYNNYLRRCGFIDIIDLFHRCQLESVVHTMILSIDNVTNDIDRLFFEYLLQSASSCGIYDVKTKLTTTETKEILVKLIDHEAKFVERMNSKDSMKYTLCTYLSLLLNTRNEHALLHCLITSTRVGSERDILLEFQRLTQLSKDEDLTMHQILHSFVRRKELKMNSVLSLQQDLTNHDNESFHVLDKYYIDIKEFLDLIEQLQMIIKENVSAESFRDLLQLISNQLCKNTSFYQYDLIMEEIIEDFQSTLSMINCTSPIQSASCEATLAGRHISQSIAYLCAKQTIDLPVLTTNYDRHLMHSSIVIDQVTNKPAEEEAVNPSMESKTKDRCLDLSTIHEASFESDSIDPSNNKTQIQVPPAKRQPLRQIDVNSFNNEDRQIENEKNSTGFILISDSDKENFPMIMKKRSMVSTTIEPSSKKQKMATNFFQSTI